MRKPSESLLPSLLLSCTSTPLHRKLPAVPHGSAFPHGHVRHCTALNSSPVLYSEHRVAAEPDWDCGSAALCYLPRKKEEALGGSEEIDSCTEKPDN